MNASRSVIDVSGLPPSAIDHRSPIWIGNALLLAIETTMFAILAATYFYLRQNFENWPPPQVNFIPPNLHPAPDLFWGTLNLGIFIVSAIPNEWYRRRARKGDLQAVRIGLIILSLFAVATVVVRYFELRHLNTDWSIDAYGSAVWTLMGLHVLHLLTDMVDTVVVTVLFFTPLVEGKRFMDAAENADYWYFVIGAWIPIYLVIYWAPRWLHA